MQDGRLYEVFGDISEAPVVPDWLWDIIRNRGDGPQPAGSKKVHIPYEFKGDDQTTTNELSDLLNSISPDCGYEDWHKCLMAIHAETGGSMAGFAIVDAWSSRGSKYDGTKALEKKWRSFRSAGVGKGTLASIARENGANLSRIAIDNIPGPDPVEQQQSAVSAKAIFENAMRNRVAMAVSEVEQEYPVGGAVDHFDIPDSLLWLGGVVGELADWICDWTSEPIRIHSIGAALVIVGNVLARKVFTKTRPTGTALYIGITAHRAWASNTHRTQYDWP